MHDLDQQQAVSIPDTTESVSFASNETRVHTHCFRHGVFDITVFSDGFITLPADIIFPDTLPGDRTPLLFGLAGTAEGAPFHMNLPLLRTENDVILVDVGAGDHYQDSAGKLFSNLQTAKVDPESITKVIFTHVHPDHAGGTLGPDGKLRYPNANYFVSEAELRFWTDRDYETNMPAALHDFARGAQRDLFAVKERLTIVKPGDEIGSDIRVLNTRGHTPGHISLELKGRDNLIITGDVVVSNSVFFEHPGWHFGFDAEIDIGVKTRQQFLDRVATEKLKLLGYHWPYPGVGYAERKDGAYRFVASDH